MVGGVGVDVDPTRGRNGRRFVISSSVPVTTWTLGYTANIQVRQNLILPVPVPVSGDRLKRRKRNRPRASAFSAPVASLYLAVTYLPA